MVLVNCGCGMKYSTEREWINIDFNSKSDNVVSHNILKSLPFDSNSVDAVFSSCMLEHFSYEEAISYLKECKRILKDGGYVRIVVPDLEDVCKEYLKVLEECKAGKEEGIKKYEYITIELLNQMTRRQSGGRMLEYWNREDKNEEYIIERTGYPEHGSGQVTFITKIKWMSTRYADLIFGRFNWYKKYSLGRYMLSGEVHRWMYDEYGLELLLREAGFDSFKRMSANQSNIDNWMKYGLEMEHSNEYKPHSLYYEACKHV